ncbi:MAG: NADH-quinone oxidoreductase subunit C [Actinomycetota bacterium]|jgi:Ni,Fe-hydrogenase III large subunit/Ni,Fe-hydrogenase III component G|nr:NADH-quinone oxidoreductase subunit C [Actinomycetota bacterium]
MTGVETLPVDLRPVGHHRFAGTVLPTTLVEASRSLFARGMRLALVSGHDDGTAMRAVYLFTAGPPDTRVELHVPLDRAHPELPTLAALSFPASRFERELSDLYGIDPLGHPQPRRLVLHQHWPANWHPMRHESTDPPDMVPDAGSFPFVAVEGHGVFEIPVGPVHAGLIEPGHFRFWVVGETILRMKARLWFVHKGIEKLLQGKDVVSGLEIAERISGDTAVGHALAYCQAIEDAHHVRPPGSAQVVRAVLLELERLYNHVADIGALCNDVGYGLAHAWALSLREGLLQLNAEVTGHRLLRGGVTPGGAHVERLPTPAELAEVRARFEELVELAGSNALIMDRFTGTATLDEAHARSLGAVGVVGRASGLEFDARSAHPFVELSDGFIPARQTTGDVLARYAIRVDEVRTSLSLLSDLVARAPELRAVGSLDAGAVHDRAAGGAGITEGWRGSIVHRVELDDEGRLARVKIVDPSFLNWPALPVSLADTIVPDFPLANKSFNLSYAGNDL